MKKWLVIVEDEQYDWIKKTANQAGIKGSVVVRTVLEKARQENEREIVNSLRDAQAKNELEKLEAKRQELDERIKEVRRGNKVPA